MVPFEAFSTDAPQSSSAFCSGCAGGTQCEIFRSKVFSWANAVGAAASARPVAAARNVWRSQCDCIESSLEVLLIVVLHCRPGAAPGTIDATSAAIQTQLAAEVKKLVGYKTNPR